MSDTVCRHCGYTWDSDSELKLTTCPSCQQKTPVNNTEPNND